MWSRHQSTLDNSSIQFIHFYFILYRVCLALRCVAPRCAAANCHLFTRTKLWMNFCLSSLSSSLALFLFHSLYKATMIKRIYTWIAVASRARLGNSWSRLRALIKCEWLIGTANTHTQYANHWLLLCAYSMAESKLTTTATTGNRRMWEYIVALRHIYIMRGYCDRMQIDDLFSFRCCFVRRNCRRLRRRRRRRRWSSSSFFNSISFFSFLRLIREIKIRCWMNEWTKKKRAQDLNGDNWRRKVHFAGHCHRRRAYICPFSSCVLEFDGRLVIVMLSLHAISQDAYRDVPRWTQLQNT